MKKPFRINIEFNIPVLAESAEQAAEFVNENYYDIARDYTDVFRVCKINGQMAKAGSFIRS